MKRYSGETEQSLKGRGEHVLAGMLLSMVKPAGGVDMATYRGVGHQPVGCMFYAVPHVACQFVFHNIGDGYPVCLGGRFERSCVEILAAASGVEGRPVEANENPRFPGFHRGNRSFKLQ